MTASGPRDTRIVYGARCAWWDSIDQVGKHPSGLPCCPHCKGMLFQLDSEAEWWGQIDRHEAEGHPGYRAMWEWSRGRCFPDFEAMQAAYRMQHQGDGQDLYVPPLGEADGNGLPQRQPGPVDGLAALAHHVARDHGGRLAVDTAEMAGGNIALTIAWERGMAGELLLVVSATRAEHH